MKSTGVNGYLLFRGVTIRSHKNKRVAGGMPPFSFPQLTFSDPGWRGGGREQRKGGEG